jgi:hypothetical protein
VPWPVQCLVAQSEWFPRSLAEVSCSCLDQGSRRGLGRLESSRRMTFSADLGAFSDFVSVLWSCFWLELFLLFSNSRCMILVLKILRSPLFFLL